MISHKCLGLALLLLAYAAVSIALDRQGRKHEVAQLRSVESTHGSSGRGLVVVASLIARRELDAGELHSPEFDNILSRMR